MGKGLDAPTIIAIIIAVVVGIIILYFLWSRGFLPFLGGASEAECRTYLIRACSGEDEYWEKADKGLCKRFFNIDADTFGNCKQDPDCQSPICNKVLSST